MYKTPSARRFKTSPCVDSKRARVYRHHAHMLKHVCAWCWYTRRRVERTHGDVWSGHTGFSACHTPHTTHTTPQHKTQHTTTHHNNTTTTPHENRDRQAETERETEKEDGDTEEKRREKRRERRGKIHFQCGGAWPFLVVVVLCLVHPVKRDLRLLKKVK